MGFVLKVSTKIYQQLELREIQNQPTLQSYVTPKNWGIFLYLSQIKTGPAVFSSLGPVGNWTRLSYIVNTVLSRLSVWLCATKPSEPKTFCTLSQSHWALNRVTNCLKIENFAPELWI